MKFLNEFSLDTNQGNEQKINKRLFGEREREVYRKLSLYSLLRVCLVRYFESLKDHFLN